MVESDNIGNNPERVEWFRKLGLGLFIHWSVDVQLGAVISHSMVGASPAYLDRYIDELPETFDPTDFDPDAWARLAKVSGFQYVVFTTKHHNGFAMWDTDTTDFNVTNTPYGKDIVAEVVDAFRRVDVPIGFHFSPDDFWLLHRQGTAVSRDRKEALPTNNPELMDHNLAQIEEQFTEYGDIDLLFIDGESDGIKTLAWDLQPNVVVTRGAIETPEQEIRTEPLDQAWEANLTIGSQWSYKAGNERYKSGTELIETLVETRAKGGNLLLNVGPRPTDRFRPHRKTACVNSDYGTSSTERPFSMSGPAPKSARGMSGSRGKRPRNRRRSTPSWPKSGGRDIQAATCSRSNRFGRRRARRSRFLGSPERYSNTAPTYVRKVAGSRERMASRSG